MTTTARKLTARYRPLRAISVGDIEKMHKLFSSVYENADVPTFLRDLSKKDGAIVVRDELTREICGFTSPGVSLYWLLISKGYKTYMLLASNFVNYHPRHDGVVDPKLAGLVRDYTGALFPGRYDERRGILDFGEGAQRLREEVAPITAEMRLNNPVINYFERSNPGWRVGHEL